MYSSIKWFCCVRTTYLPSFCFFAWNNRALTKLQRVLNSFSWGQSLHKKNGQNWGFTQKKQCFRLLSYHDSFFFLFCSYTECRLEAVGKPVYYRYTDSLVGAWMQDSSPLTPKDAEKFWVTLNHTSTDVYEYANKTVYRENAPTKVHSLPSKYGSFSVSAPRSWSEDAVNAYWLLGKCQLTWKYTCDDLVDLNCITLSVLFPLK